ncbi:hypothetical protein E1264_04725 [Actinomadura sp. KC216]|uniref:hypothetical protein n=1 Tax=Actinomadura sp. KC216 TaxID=2530370 RepID=UPI001047795B|nr:hypothetical protein [Actinomadura sp. KC216]TDB90553.1 hypothetical protein E1264_04725 [Actinomadura sp. KC216]
MRSRGELRLRGGGDQGHPAELGQIGLIAAGWQRAVSATGAALEDFRALGGVLPPEIVRRTTLVLNAASSAGSIILSLEPRTPPANEDEPGGNVALINTPRPLADRASAVLIGLLGGLGTDTPVIDDSAAASLGELGPRVGSTLADLARVITRSGITLDATWAEPGSATVRASITPAAAGRMRSFIAGRGLDAEEQLFTGTLRTVSDTQSWLVALPDGETVKMSAKELPYREISHWNIGATVQLRVRVTLQEQPDGHVRRTLTIFEVTALDGY